MKQVIHYAVLASLLLTKNAWAFEEAFSGNVLTSMTLSASIAQAPLQPVLPAQNASSGNTISGEAFSNNIGVLTVAQNTGTAIQQQGVGISIGQLMLGQVQ